MDYYTQVEEAAAAIRSRIRELPRIAILLRSGPRFPDMSAVYSTRLRTIADQAARQMQVALPHGVYVALLGPSYETPAEIRYLRTIGADAVGMSTVPEAIAARHMGLEVLGI